MCVCNAASITERGGWETQEIHKGQNSHQKLAAQDLKNQSYLVRDI
jgi:hypothetical protein